MRMSIPAIAFLVIAAGCGKHRSTDEIFAEKLKLPQVYVGVKSFKQIIDTGDKGTVMEGEEEYFPALECTNPDCPARKGNDPVLFALPRSARENDCPHCLKIRKVQNETSQEKAKYAKFIRAYVLPETLARQKQLDAEFESSAKRDAKQRR